MAQKYGINCEFWNDGRRLLNANQIVFKTFSVGIFPWVPKANGKGQKKGKAVVRVKGDTNNSMAVFKMANAIKRQLQAGTYEGKAMVVVKKEPKPKKAKA